MNNNLWNRLDSLVVQINKMFDDHLESFENKKHDQHFEGWSDDFWNSKNIRKCHLKTIRNDKMWLLHINIFPKDSVNLPILGFDIVASKSKISGSFFDFSPNIPGANHALSVLFKNSTKGFEWNKPRELPEWGKEIFSKDMIAAGAIREGEELEQLIDVSTKLIKLYLISCNDPKLVTNEPTIKYMNKYCKNQKMNRHLHRSILSMGISEEEKNRYINNVLFEEI